MELFGADPTVNLLPRDGVVTYYGPIFEANEAQDYFERLMAEVEWRPDEVVLYGKHIVTARKVAWYGDADFSYAYSGTVKAALAWTPALLALKAEVEKVSGATYNSCLLNLYHNGGEGMGWHSDDEKTLAQEASIASVSLGAERKFCFKHRQEVEHVLEPVTIMLEHGSLLVMEGATQKYWLHSLPKSAKIKEPRINLTFRTFVGQGRTIKAMSNDP